MGAARLRRDVVAQPRAVARVRLRALLGGEHAALRADRRRQDKRRDAHAAARDRAAPPARRLVRPRRLQDRVRGADEGARAGDGAQLWEAARAVWHHRQRAHRGPAAHQGADRADAAHRHDAREVGHHHAQGGGPDVHAAGAAGHHRRDPLARRGARAHPRGDRLAHAVHGGADVAAGAHRRTLDRHGQRERPRRLARHPARLDLQLQAVGAAGATRGAHRGLPGAALLPAHGGDEQADLPRHHRPLARPADPRLRLEPPPDAADGARPDRLLLGGREGGPVPQHADG
mmetsp:Transcript_28346/g.85728  ORF Transcript_28346/g.85728 Transcript_28346/m.85728 type:complete len:288 (-) Transcript_28346:1352-2215(-)